MNSEQPALSIGFVINLNHITIVHCIFTLGMTTTQYIHGVSRYYSEHDEREFTTMENETESAQESLHTKPLIQCTDF